MLSFYGSLGSELWCPLRFLHKIMFVSSLPPLVCRRARVLFTFVSSLLPLVCVSYLRFLCLFAHSGVQYILCCVFALFFVVLLLPVSLDCDLLIAPSVFSDVYLTIFIPCYNLILLWLNFQCSNIQWYSSSAMS